MSKVSKVVKNIKKITAITLAAIMICGIFSPSIVFASEANIINFEDFLVYEFTNELSEEYFDIENVEIDHNEIAIEVSAEDANVGQVSVEVEITLGGQYITLITHEYNAAGFLEERFHFIDLGQLEDFAGADGSHVEFTLYGAQQNGEEMELAPFVHLVEPGIRLGFDLTGRLLQLGQLAVVEGTAWLGLLTNVVMNGFPNVFGIFDGLLGGLLGGGGGGGLLGGLLGGGGGGGLLGGLMGFGELEAFGDHQDIQAFNYVPTHNFYAVMILNGEIFIGEGMDLDEAANRLRNGENIWSATAAEARELARLAGNRMPSFIQNDAINGLRTESFLDYILPNPRTGGRAYFGTNLRNGWW